MNKKHDVQRVAFMDGEMVVTVDGTTHRFELTTVSQRLCQATQTERERYEISPSGYGIHWPLIDEDLSIDGLLGITHTPSFGLKRAA